MSGARPAGWASPSRSTLVTPGVQEQTQMSARRRKPRKPQRLRVNVHKPTEVLAWANYWGCTQQNVRDAVKISGAMVEDVEDWLEINVVLPR
jgi:hypothetical protein